MKWSGKIVEIYDLWWSKNTTEEVPFWQELCVAHFKKVSGFEQPMIVELCSGTGRILIPLIDHLKNYYSSILGIGLDFSTEMNNLLVKRVHEINLDRYISVREFDLSKPDWSSALGDKQIDIVLLPFNHFELVGDAEIQENILKNVSWYLKPKGIFVSANYNPYNRFKDCNGIKELRRIIPDPDKSKNRILFYWRQQTRLDDDCKYALVTYGIECVEWLNEGLHIESLPATMRIRYLMEEELRELFSKYGFNIIAEYGTYKFDPFKPDSRRRIIIAEKC
jgi:SAM-dependent methyltransferase